VKNTILYILMILLILLVGCRGGITEFENKETNTPSNTIDITKEEPVDVSIFYPRDSAVWLDTDFISEWQDYIYDKYGLRIKLVYTKNDWAGKDSTEENSNTGLNVNDLWEKGKDGGLVYIRDFYTFGSLVRSGLIEPVGEYINDIPEFAVLDKRMLEQFSWDGSIWAFPFYHDFSLNVRAYNKDWLDKYDKGVPETLDDFLDYAYFVRDSDPDENQIADTYVQVYRYTRIFSEFYDVFSAYGCYPLAGSFPISYNPNTEKLEVCVFSDGYIQAMNYIKSLTDEGCAITSDINVSSSDKLKIKCATSYNYDFGELGDCMNMEPGYYLLGDNDRNLVRVLFYPQSFAVLKNTDDPAAMIQKLLKPLTENPDSYIDFYCGIEGESYLTKDDYFVYSFQRPNIGIRTGINIRDVSRKPIAFEESLYNAKSTILYGEITKEFREEARNLIDTDLMYTVNNALFSAELRRLNDRILTLTVKLNRSILTGEKTIPEALTEYRAKLEEYGIFDEVQELNRKLGFE